MEARKNSEYLRSIAAAVQEFRAALVEFLELHVRNEGSCGWGGIARGIAPAVFPRDGADPNEIERRRTKVSRLSGLAGAAVPLTNIAIRVQGVGVIDPIAAWQTITQPKPVLEAPDILGACDQALGRLDGLILEAEAELPATNMNTTTRPPLTTAATSTSASTT